MDDSGVNSCAFQVFIAKYGYDPVSLSPNDNPDAELAFSAGDYLFIYGDVDEDGFYEGELMDGKKGLVPSNFIEKVPDEDLKDLDKTFGNGIDFTPVIEFPTLDSPEQPIITEIIDRSCIVPPPKDLHQERQLSCSYLVAWFPPEESILQAEGIDIECYQVHCNDQLMCTIYRGDRTKALLEKLDTTKSHRVSLRAVATDGRTSCDQLCTITIGKNARLAPSAVEVVEIAKRSAVVQWCLASSYLQHRVSVDDQWDHILPPGVFKCQISGLMPNSSHTICISCIQNTSDDRSFVSSSVSFVTLPRDFPDPPTDVQADIGPQKGTILVTWTPALRDSLESTKPRKTNITGYSIYIDGHKVKQLHSPTSDHIVLSWKNYDFQEGVNNLLTIRTMTDRVESPDSSPATVLSNVLIDEIIRGKPQVFDKGGSFEERRVTINEVVNKNEITNHEDKKSKQRFYGDTGKISTLPQIEITRDSLSDSSFDDHVSLEPTKSPAKLKDKKVQTSPKLMKSSRESEDPKLSTVKRKDVAVGCDETSIIAGSTKTNKMPSTVDGARNCEEDSLLGSDIEKVEPNKVRLFVGLFDYNPISMSPNQDFSSEELQFCEGQLLKVFGEKDADGFYTGESNGVRGLIPSNMVTEVLVYNPLTAEQLLKDNLALCRNKSSSIKSNRPPVSKQPPVLGRQATLGSNRPRRMVAIYNYSPNKNVSNNDSEYELSLKPGDRVVIFGEPDADGFVRAEVGQRKGLVPINYLRPATPIPRPQNPQVHPDLKPRTRGQRDESGRRPSGSRMLPSHIPGGRRMPPDGSRHIRSFAPSQSPAVNPSASNNEQLLNERDNLTTQLDPQAVQQSMYTQ